MVYSGLKIKCSLEIFANKWKMCIIWSEMRPHMQLRKFSSCLFVLCIKMDEWNGWSLEITDNS